MNGANGKNNQPRLTLTIEGPEVKSGRIEVEHLSQILEAFQKSLHLTASHIFREHSTRVSRQERALIQKLSTLEIIAFKAGSFSITLGLVTPTTPLPIPDAGLIGQTAMKNLVDGLHLIEAQKAELEHHSDRIRQLVPFARMAPMFTKGVEHIRVHFSGKTDSTALLNRYVCDSIKEHSHRKTRQDIQTAESITAVAERAIEPLTAGELLHSALVGMWRNRSEMNDPGLFARQIRERAQSRKK